VKLASFERPDEGDYRDLAVAIGASILMKLRKSVAEMLSCKISVFALAAGWFPIVRRNPGLAKRPEDQRIPGALPKSAL
jgi:hypothetical protein